MKNENSLFKDISLPSHFIMDTDLLPLMDKAESGCICAQENLYNAFFLGNKTVENYDMAKYYLGLAYNTLNDPSDIEHHFARYDILWNKLLLEGKYGSLDDVRQSFCEMLDHMRKHIPLEKWDYSQFEFFNQLLSFEE